MRSGVTPGNSLAWFMQRFEDVVVLLRPRDLGDHQNHSGDFGGQVEEQGSMQQCSEVTGARGQYWVESILQNPTLPPQDLRLCLPYFVISCGSAGEYMNAFSPAG